MYFARPEYLNLLWLGGALGVVLFWSLRQRKKRLTRFVARPLAAALAEDHSRARASLRALLVLLFFVFGVLTLSRPQWGTRVETVRRKGVDIFVALDTSYSMDAEDVAPSRLAQAKSEARALISRLRGDRVGLIAFAGNAFVLCPLTLDYGAASLFLDAADTGSVPDPGTSLAAAIRTANSAFVAKERKFKVLILITDGEDLEGQVEEALAKAKEAGIVIYGIGIGTPEGRPIPIRDEKGGIIEYRKDPKGQVVVSSLDERSLAYIAMQTGGRYFRATTSEDELDEIYSEVSQLEKKELESRLVQNLEDRFQYPLGAAILCLVAEGFIGERRRPRPHWHGRFLAR
ncbi:MAG: VWA domain-containing protein [Acidobacteria bacterium]|nr:VWA domain-containing protein [Acidobacteriota bacterium]